MSSAADSSPTLVGTKTQTNSHNNKNNNNDNKGPDRSVYDIVSELASNNDAAISTTYIGKTWYCIIFIMVATGHVTKMKREERKKKNQRR